MHLRDRISVWRWTGTCLTVLLVMWTHNETQVVQGWMMAENLHRRLQKFKYESVEEVSINSLQKTRALIGSFDHRSQTNPLNCPYHPHSHRPSCFVFRRPRSKHENRKSVFLPTSWNLSAALDVAPQLRAGNSLELPSGSETPVAARPWRAERSKQNTEGRKSRLTHQNSLSLSPRCYLDAPSCCTVCLNLQRWNRRKTVHGAAPPAKQMIWLDTGAARCINLHFNVFETTVTSRYVLGAKIAPRWWKSLLIKSSFVLMKGLINVAGWASFIMRELSEGRMRASLKEHDKPYTSHNAT